MLTVNHIWVVISGISVMTNKYCIAGNFKVETFANFTVLWLFAKVLSTKFGGMVSFSTA